jgi:hypothetical protein
MQLNLQCAKHAYSYHRDALQVANLQFFMFYYPSIMMIVLSMVKNLYFCKFSDLG